MSTSFGVYPEAHELVEDAAARTLTVSNRFYTVTHSLQHGGAITALVYPNGSNRNLLLGPCGSEVALAGGRTGSELNHSSPGVTVRREGEDLLLTFSGKLHDTEGHELNIEYEHTYCHRWGHVRVDKRLRFPAGTRVSHFCVHSWSVRPELTHYGVRPGAQAEASAWTGAFGVCQWGRFQPGAAFDSPYTSRYVPRYVCCADPGREGLEWFVGSDLAQWDYQLTGVPGQGNMTLTAQTQPPGVHFSVSPLELGRGGTVLGGDYHFRYYLGVPLLSGRANPLFLHRAFQRKNWPTKDQIADYAARGVTSLHFHHDGDSHRDGQFWRDGSYPPFGPDDMREYDRVIADCHRHGLRVCTYFSNKELHPTVEAYKQHGADWARLPDDSGEQLHNAYSGDEFGAQMCLRSGWLEFHKEYIDRVLSHHALDGTYYDWNVALYCHNTRHVPDGEQFALPRGGGAWAFSPAGHWDMDELLDLMIWTRRRVGPEGFMIIHNTMVPMAATENYADRVVAMEWGYSRLAIGAPPLAELPLEWTFMGHRARGVIGYGCLEKDAPERVHRQMTLRALLTGVAPWPALDLDLEMFLPLAGRDLTGYRFADPQSGVAGTTDTQSAAAAYCANDEALVLVGNLAAEARPVICRVNATGLGEKVVVESGGAETVMTTAELVTTGLTVTVAGDDMALVRVRRQG